MSGYLSGRTSLTTVQTADIAADAVTTAKIAPDAITAAEIGDNVLDSEHYAATSIDNEHLADDAVNAAEIGALSAALDINGQELILDADADTSITSDTDDQIDVKIAGADDFRFTANNFNVLSGSTLTIDSGATITNSGTATNFGVDPESAYAGVLETNANFVDQVIFGPAVDGMAWNGLWSKASVFSSLMLATVEDAGSTAQVNIWDLTEQSAGTISTTPLATVDIASITDVTCIAACMGYLIVGGSDTNTGMHIIDPHDGTWAERTTGWPKSLHTTTAPALVSNSIGAVGAGFSKQPIHDPRTNGPMPSFAICFLAGADCAGIMKDDGTYFSTNARAPDGTNTLAAFVSGKMLFTGTDDRLLISDDIHKITADDFADRRMAGTAADIYPYGNGSPPTTVAAAGEKIATGSANGLQVLVPPSSSTDLDDSGTRDVMQFTASRTYNTGFFKGDTVGAWCMNSKTVDRSHRANTLTENGTVTEAAVESGCELTGYSGFSTSNNLSRADDSDYNSIGNNACSLILWYKSTADGDAILAGLFSSDDSLRFMLMQNGGQVMGISDGASAYLSLTEEAGESYRDSKWHMAVLVRRSNTDHELYVDGQTLATSSTDTGSLSGTIQFYVGRDGQNGSSGASGSMYVSQVRLINGTYPTAAEVRDMYEAERGMFVANAECHLQSGSTDAILDLDVDPLTGKVLVTQTDAITIFDGCVVDSKPTVNSGNSEKGRLWGNLRTEQNSANAYVTAPAVDQRQVNEMVRGLASDLPAGVDLSKAKAWAICTLTGGTLVFRASHNIKSMTDNGVGDIRDITFSVPFKGYFAVIASGGGHTIVGPLTDDGSRDVLDSGNQIARLSLVNDGGTSVDGTFYFACFGELENE